MNQRNPPDDEFDRRVTAMLSMVPRGAIRSIYNRVTGKEILQEEMAKGPFNLSTVSTKRRATGSLPIPARWRHMRSSTP